MSKILAVSGKGNMLKIEDAKETKGYIWYFLSDEVQKYASSIGIKSGDVVEFKSEEIRGEDTIIFLKKEGGVTSEFKCENCGASLKDNKYKTCYTCSMKAREEEAKSPEGLEKQESIKRMSVLSSATNAISSGMNGQFKDIDTLLNAIKVAYHTLYKEISG